MASQSASRAWRAKIRRYRPNSIGCARGAHRRALSEEKEKEEERERERRHQARPTIQWLDLRGSGLSVLERLLVEEMLWKDPDSGSWLIVGHHDPTRNRYLSLPPPPQKPQGSSSDPRHPYSGDSVIVMGIGGKPQSLLDLDLVRRDRVQVIKRFSGGGTVVLDPDSIWTTVIGRNHDDAERRLPILPSDRRFPRPIMDWSMSLFGPVVQELNRRQQQQQQRRAGSRSSQMGGRRKTMVMDTKSCAAENTGRVITLPPQDRQDRRSAALPSLPGTASLSLRENDYVLADEKGDKDDDGRARKVAGNAQSIGKSGWLHHTSWLWDYSADSMRYLRLPAKRPAYREDRPHDDFLASLRSRLPDLTKNDFYECLKAVAGDQFEMSPVTLPTVMSALREQQGDMQNWIRGSRTRIVEDLGADFSDGRR
jgi:lipoate-protein ligase A